MIERLALLKVGAEDTFFEEPVTYEDMKQDIFFAIHPDFRDAAVAEMLVDGGPQGFELRRRGRSDVEVRKAAIDRVGRPQREVGGEVGLDVPEHAGRNAGQAHAAANGLNGYAGLVRLVEAQGYDVTRSRSQAAQVRAAMRSMCGASSSSGRSAASTKGRP